MHDTMKPCPCCGAQPFLFIQRNGLDGVMYIECSECGIGTPEVCYDLTGTSKPPRPYSTAMHDVVTIWNRRTVIQAVDTPRRRRRAELEALRPS